MTYKGITFSFPFVIFGGLWSGIHGRSSLRRPKEVHRKFFSPHLIERDQIGGYFKGTYIGENLRAISDIIEQHQEPDDMKTKRVWYFFDFEKAFDSLEQDYLFKVLDIMNFG